jgi:hypothetical protein
VVKKIYGVDLSKKITPIMVRDAIINCFVQAHSEVLEMMKECIEFKSEQEFEEMKLMNVKFLVESKFDEVGGNFDNPTKEEIMKVLDKLAEFGKKFRKTRIVEKHYGEIMRLVKKME